MVRNCNDFENRITLLCAYLSRNCNELERTITALYSFSNYRKLVTTSNKDNRGSGGGLERMGMRRRKNRRKRKIRGRRMRSSPQD